MKDHPLGGRHSEKDSQKSHSPRAALVLLGSTSGRSSARGQAMALAQPQERRHPQDLKSAHGGFLSVVPAL